MTSWHRKPKRLGMDVAIIHQWQHYAARLAKTIGRAAAMRGFCTVLNDSDPASIAYAAIALAHIASENEVRACLRNDW